MPAACSATASSSKAAAAGNAAVSESEMALRTAKGTSVQYMVSGALGGAAI